MLDFAELLHEDLPGKEPLIYQDMKYYNSRGKAFSEMERYGA
jgi:hypothetical protein